MKIIELWQPIPKHLTALRVFQAYLVLIFLASFYYLMNWPIMAGDTDLWYHLNGGRYILEHHSLPTTSFFSFLSPLRQWVDYYWLFQVVVYKIYSWVDYYGLVFFRSAMFLGTLLLVLAHLFKNQKEDEFPFFRTLIFALLLLFLIPRSVLVRPHAFSYFFIASFLYILEFHPRKAFLLPILAILWSNLHGIEYPVMLLIILSYILEFLIVHVRRKAHIQKDELGYILPLIVCLGAVYLTPHGSRLLGVPLISTEYASQYISELRIRPFENLFNFQVSLFSWNLFGLFNILLLCTLLSLGNAILKLRVRTSHLIMLAGGFFLLTKAGRLTYEFVLISLPFLRAFPWKLSLVYRDKRVKSAWFIMILIFLFLPLFWIRDSFKNSPRFPFSSINLPEGVVTFLNRISAGGRVLNHPNKGGYLEWMLYPKYKIFMDMEVPFLFTDEDFFVAHHAFSNEEVFRKVLLEYDPSFITAPVVREKFKEIIKKFPDYEMVFFDYAEVLYVNKRHFPEIAVRYAIKDIDPFALSSKGIDLALKKKSKDALLQDLERLLEIYPKCSLKNQAMGMIYNKCGDHRKALPYSESLIQNFPESPMGYRIKGDALSGLKLYDEAISCYQAALERSPDAEKKGIYKQMGYVYNEQRKFDQAYEALKKATDLFAEGTSYKDLFDFGSIALSAGRPQEAMIALRFARKKLPPDDVEWGQKINEKLSLIRIRGEN